MHGFTSTSTRSHATTGPRLPILTWVRIARQRRILATLDDRALADMGLTRQEALAEARRPFWDMG